MSWRDILAIFHVSFHPTKGNILDWSAVADEAVSLENVEFSALPSGLHQRDEDVIYFTLPAAHSGLAVFRRRATNAPGHRGSRLGALGIITRRPTHGWKKLEKLYMEMLGEEGGDKQLGEAEWALAQRWFDEQGGTVEEEEAEHPAQHLPHVLRTVGPAFVTLAKHVVGGRRVLVYSSMSKATSTPSSSSSSPPTATPIHAACTLCHLLGAASPAPAHVLGCVGLMDFSRLVSPSSASWIACTTDAIFLEKPQCYDILFDVSEQRMYTPSLIRSAGGEGGVEEEEEEGEERRAGKWKLSGARWAWSDVRVFNSLAVQEDRDKGPWDVWRLYEDVCMLCASLWGGGVRLEGAEDVPLVRQVGAGIEGRPSTSSTTSSRAPLLGTMPMSLGGINDGAQLLAALEALFRFHLATLETLMPPPPITEDVVLTAKDLAAMELGPLSAMDARYVEWLGKEYGGAGRVEELLVPVDESASERSRGKRGRGVKVVVRRGWKDVLGVFLGYS
ncbi:hypothetical protein BDZ89DRAFT_1161175 [Hymenopellis radicata]|nr:hypothetical protein BDZ89DRAFT_1161175 [Hymenopellis radicata]